MPGAGPLTRLPQVGCFRAPLNSNIVKRYARQAAIICARRNPMDSGQIGKGAASGNRCCPPQSTLFKKAHTCANFTMRLHYASRPHVDERSLPANIGRDVMETARMDSS